ncbi:hypothetical protein [Chryseobacterium sp. SC28]|uniref:hypothetical protein n=1 Tax=Chryseobacterium sp. SC28 TaxID=2268028 RepID=UPI000F647165|nr:hypothetical protein [Chryseobacterium sp. SC28]RRQ46198.1 hypothetical protein DTW91_05760 [Chryseobacterium sp. SC28]
MNPDFRGGESAGGDSGGVGGESGSGSSGGDGIERDANGNELADIGLAGIKIAAGTAAINVTHFGDSSDSGSNNTKNSETNFSNIHQAGIAALDNLNDCCPDKSLPTISQWDGDKGFLEIGLILIVLY